jgi:CBS domain containing-hemolysin-like protein
MALFITAVTIAIGVSALCSLTEAGLYAVRLTYVRQLAQSGRRAGTILLKFKKNMGRPITAILILNTFANTAGAAIAGAQARLLFGDRFLIWFSIFFTFAILTLSEILPKVAGVAYNRPVARFSSIPLSGIIAALLPLVWLGERASGFLRRARPEPMAPEEEVHQMAALSAEEGSILPLEATLVRNVLRLNEIKARDIMTPRTVVFRVSADLTVRDLADEVLRLPHARIPIADPDEPDHWVGVVLRRDLLAALARDEFDTTIASLAKPLDFVPQVMLGHELLHAFQTRRVHLLGVLDEFGGVAGIVTLEDVLESLLGQEIVDETDAVVDMQDAARRQAQRLGRMEGEDGERR